MKKILVTGGAGFIGSHFVEELISKKNYEIIIVDKLTYAGKIDNMESFIDSDKVKFFKLDICDKKGINNLFNLYNFDVVVNFAAESHVDNSIKNPDVFIDSNISGVHNLLRISMEKWSEETDWRDSKLFIQISTDEVYGSLGKTGKFTEFDRIRPSSPYSSSKAAADLVCLSYFITYGYPVIITRSSNNYGPRQDYEKLLPKVVLNVMNNKPVPIYGTGENVRDWIYVKDNCNAIIQIMDKGVRGEIYNIGGKNELSNIDLVRRIFKIQGANDSLIDFVEDRKGHDFRYAIDDTKVQQLIGDYLHTTLDEGLNLTILAYKFKLFL